jgi:hypothetical protein
MSFTAFVKVLGDQFAKHLHAMYERGEHEPQQN